MKTLKPRKIILFFSTLGLLNSAFIQLGLFYPMPKLLSSLMDMDTNALLNLTYPLVKIVSLIYPGDTWGFEYILLPTSGLLWGSLFGVLVYFCLNFFRRKSEF